MKIERILAGIDFGPFTEEVIEYSSLFAEVFNASLNLLYVIDYLITPPTYLTHYMEEEKRIAEEKFSELKKKLIDKGIKTKNRVIVGRLHESFDAEIRKINADMLILGFMHHAVRRSSSEKLIKGLQMPMLVVRGEKAGFSKKESIKIDKILCPTDFSDTSGKALEVAKELRDFFSSKLYVLNILPSYVIKKKMKKYKDYDRAIKELFEQTSISLNKFMKVHDIKDSGMIEQDEPDKRIVSFSVEKDIDLIVMGARGLSFIKGMIIGSVTDAVLKSSPCPVLVIH
ncbi:MAG: universal stress protein [Nitrospirota bacterium]